MLVAAISAISGAAVLVRLAEGVEPLAVAFWRTGSAAALLSGLLLVRRQPLLGPVPQQARRLGALGGVLLALHFVLWFTSLHLTTVLRSTLLACLTPVWAGLLEWLILKVRPKAPFWVGVAFALAGVAAMSGGIGERAGEGRTAASLLEGDLLALAAGLLSAGYLIIGRVVRPSVEINRYGALVYGACALALLPAALLLGVPLSGWPAASWLAIAGMVVGPQLIGHLGLNYAVGYLPAATVTAAILLEPVGAALLGALVLHEIPGRQEALGALVVLVGVGIATLGPSLRRRA